MAKMHTYIMRINSAIKIAICVVGMLLICGCTAGTDAAKEEIIEGVASQFFLAMVEGDSERLYGLSVDKFREEVHLDSFIQSQARERERFKVISFEILKAKLLSDEKASIQARVVTEKRAPESPAEWSRESFDTSLELYLEGGDWHVYVISPSEYPQ